MAGFSDPNWRNKSKGPRPQFRLSTEPFRSFKSTYPVHLTDVMDIPSTQSDLRRAGYVSPIRETRTLAVREYEQTIEELRKENFDLKLKIFLIEQSQKNQQKNKGASNEEQDNTVQVIVELKVEADALKKELSAKEQILQETLDQVEKYASDLSELQEQFLQQQEQLSSFQQLPYEQEWSALKEEKDSLLKEIECLGDVLLCKDDELQSITKQLEEITKQNKALEAKNKKSSLAIQGIVHKYYKDMEMIPLELRPLVQSAVVAAKEEKGDISGALEELKASLYQLRSRTTKEKTNKSHQKENKDPSQRKESKEHSSDSLLDSRSRSTNQSFESLGEVSNNSKEGLEQMYDILRENESLRGDNLEKNKSIRNLNSTCYQLDQTVKQLQDQLSEAVAKAKNLEKKISDEKSRTSSSLPKVHTSVQTAVQWHLLQSNLSEKFLQTAGQSNNMDELKEEILMMLLVIEQKDKEISNIEQKLKSLQSDDFILERNELHQRLAQSCSVNNELMDHLKRLERFMEDLLQHNNLESSGFESASDISNFLSQLSTCLNETKKLSNVLYDNLSVCEGSKIFDPDETLCKNHDLSQTQSYSPENKSQFSLNESNILDTQGRNNFTSSLPEFLKNQVGTGKRRLSFSSSFNATKGIDPNNMVVVGTSNNEDLILVLNDKGDPEDVLIRNSTSYPIPEGEQLHRRCWDPNSRQFYNTGQFKPGAGGTLHSYCQSSDSDIWSEPDRDVSLQRIGIDVQKSPTTQKSPRRSRIRRNATDDVCSQKNESSSSLTKIQSWATRRKSSDTSKSSFISSRKSMQQSSKNVNQEEVDHLHETINNLSQKCNDQDNELEEIKKELENKLDFIDNLTREKEQLSKTVNHLKEELSIIRQEKDSISSVGIETQTKMSSENENLKSTIKNLKEMASKSDDYCHNLKTELEQTKERLEALDKKCAKFEKELSENVKSMEDYIEELRGANKEKLELMNEINELSKEKNNLLQTLQSEKEGKLHLEVEMGKLNNKLEESLVLNEKLQTEIAEVESVKNSLLKEKEVAENAYQSSKTMCNNLKTNTELMEGHIASLKSKCDDLEKELQNSSESSQQLLDYFSKMKIVFLSNFKSLINVCKQHLDCRGLFDDTDGLLSSNVANADNKDNVKMLFDNFISLNTRFEQTICFLSEEFHDICSLKEQSETIKEEMNSLKEENSQLNVQLNHLQSNLERSKSLKSEYQSKLLFLQQELDVKQNELIKMENSEEELKSYLEESKQVLGNKERSIYTLSTHNSSLEAKLANLQVELDNDRNLLNSKDEEITRLQERIFNLQTQVNSLLSDKMTLISQMKHSEQMSENLGRSRSRSERAGSESNDTSIGSISFERKLEQKECERHLKKIKAYKVKISMMEKRIEILEKEKNDLRQELLAQGDRIPYEDIDGLKMELEDSKEKLNAKTSFIKDLKNEMYRTCNSLVDKQKEVDELKRKLSAISSQTAVSPQPQSSDDLNHRYSDPVQLAREENIKMLKSHKWELIQAVLEQQKQFYERKNIHLGHFEKFKNHIEKLRSLQHSPMTKAESEPFLNSLSDSGYAAKCDSTLKNLRIELELDVECLQNFKIFLTRFFVPLVLQTSQDVRDDSRSSDYHPPTKNVSVQTKFSDVDDKNWRRDHLHLDLSKDLSHTRTLCSLSSVSSTHRLATIASFVTCNLDMIERVSKDVKAELDQIQEFELDVKDLPKSIDVKSLLLKLSTELNHLEERMDQISHLNSLLKSMFSIEKSTPQSPCKHDTSDRESLLSEETISRSGSLSPMSFEDHFPSKLVRRQENGSENTTPAEREQNKDPFLQPSHKSSTVGGSQDSIFQRSHFSSPDLGIESDPNRESSAPEHAGKEDFSSRVSKNAEKQQSRSVYGSNDISTINSSNTLHAIGHLQHYELLKKEVQESLVGIKAILSRTVDGLQHVAKFTSPRKNLEYSTFKAIKDASGNIEVCLKEATKLVDSFWIAPCPSVKELKNLIQMNQEQEEKLKDLQESKSNQEKHFNEVFAQLKHAELLRENMEKKISKKLLKTKKVLRQAEMKMLESETQDLPSIPKYPVEEPVCQKKK